MSKTSTGVLASKNGLALGSGCHSMAGPFDLIPLRNLFEFKVDAQQMMPIPAMVVGLIAHQHLLWM